MKKFCFIFLASTAFAALPPLAQSTREIQTLLADSRLYESLGSAELIQQITRTEKGYLIITSNYAMEVDVRYVKNQKWVGPAQLEFQFQPAVDLHLKELEEEALSREETGQ